MDLHVPWRQTVSLNTPGKVYKGIVMILLTFATTFDLLSVLTILAYSHLVISLADSQNDYKTSAAAMILDPALF